MLRRTLLIGVVWLAGCADRSGDEAAFSAAQQAYLNCAVQEARGLARQTAESAATIADVSMYRCSQHRTTALNYGTPTARAVLLNNEPQLRAVLTDVVIRTRSGAQ